MLKIRAFFRNRGPVSVVLSVVCAVLFVVTAVNAATTISTNINTGGTLTVTGVGHLADDLNIYGNDLNLGTGTATSTISGGFGIGIGTTTPGAALSVATSTTGLNTAFLISNLGSNYTMFVQDSADDTSPIVIDAAGNMGIATATPGTLFSVQGVGNFNIGTSTLYAGLTLPTLAATSTSASSTIQLLNSTALGVTGTTTLRTGAIVGPSGSPVYQILFGTCALNPGLINASSTLLVSCTGATGVTAADKIFITATQLEYGLSLVSASSTTDGAINIAVHNNGNASTSGTFGSGIDPASTNVSWMAIK